MKDIILFLPPELETPNIVRLLSTHHIHLTHDINKATVIIDLNDIDSSLREALEKMPKPELHEMPKPELHEMPMLFIPKKNKKVYPKEKSLFDRYAKIKNNRNQYIQNRRNTRYK